ncbi:hypothetical protein U1Q18_038065 [Sarracenia purpurea var. burkii]
MVVELSPKPGDGFLSRILRQQRVLLPGLVDVLEDDKGLGDGFIAMDDEHRYLLVDGIEFQKQRTLVLHVFFHVLVLHPLQLQSPFKYSTLAQKKLDPFPPINFTAPSPPIKYTLDQYTTELYLCEDLRKGICRETSRLWKSIFLIRT